MSRIKNRNTLTTDGRYKYYRLSLSTACAQVINYLLTLNEFKFL